MDKNKELTKFKQHLENESINDVDNQQFIGLTSDFIKNEGNKNILKTCITAGIVNELKTLNQNQSNLNKNNLVSNLASKLEKEHGLKLENAEWAIDAWKYILGISDEKPKNNYSEGIEKTKQPTKKPTEVNIMGHKFTKWDMIRMVVLASLAIVSIVSFSIFHSKYGDIPFLNIYKLMFLTFVLGFTIGLGIGNIISDETTLRIFGVFLLPALMYTLMHWWTFFDGHLFILGFGLILSIALVSYIYHTRKYLWIKVANGFIISIIAVGYISYIVHLSSNAILDIEGYILGISSFFIFPIIGYMVVIIKKREGKNTIILLGQKGAGKTIFTYMLYAVSKDISIETIANKSNYYDELGKFVDDKSFPSGTSMGTWNFIMMCKKTFLTEKNIFYVDCAGGIQEDILEKIYNNGDYRKFKHLENILKKTCKNVGGELEEYVNNKMLKKPISIEQITHLRDCDKGNSHNDGDKATIAFIKLIINSNKLIILVDGYELLVYFNKEHEKLNNMYTRFLRYGSVINLKKFSKVAIVITKGHLFGANKENYLDKIEVIREKYIEKCGGTIKLLEDIKQVRSKYKLFCIGVPSAECVCENCDCEIKHSENHSKCPNCNTYLPCEKYTHENEIFGVNDVINWI